MWRPVKAEELESGLYHILGPAPEDETWEFPPGSVVRVEMKMSGISPELCPVAIA